MLSINALHQCFGQKMKKYLEQAPTQKIWESLLVGKKISKGNAWLQNLRSNISFFIGSAFPEVFKQGDRSCCRNPPIWTQSYQQSTT